MRALIAIAALAACTAQPQQQDEASTEPLNAAAGTTAEESALVQMPPWDGAREAGVDFRAVGQEPGWMVDIYSQDRIVALMDYGQSIATFPRPEPAYPQEGAIVYETEAGGRSLSITIRRFPCQDVMSGEDYPATVEVVLDGRTLQGCGRSV